MLRFPRGVSVGFQTPRVSTPRPLPLHARCPEPGGRLRLPEVVLATGSVPRGRPLVSVPPFGSVPVDNITTS